MKTSYQAAVLILINYLVVCINVAFAQSNFKPIYINGYTQGTTYHLTYYAKDSIVRKQEITEILNKIDSSLSVYKPYSLISKFNNPACMEVIMDEHLRKVVKKSLEIYKKSGGIFDITVYPLVRAWGFSNKEISGLPDAATIKQILPYVGSDKLLLKDNKLSKKIPGVQIDVDGIAQGYTVDVISEYFNKKKIKNYLVEVGGELRVKGKKQPENKTMQVGIEGPAKNAQDEPVIQKVVKMDNGGITTSGNYRKYFKEGDKVFSHSIDPKTGYPVQNQLIAVTVKAKDAITADGYDNVLIGMGLTNALKFLKHHTFLQAYFIYHKKNGIVTDTATAGFFKLK